MFDAYSLCHPDHSQFCHDVRLSNFDDDDDDDGDGDDDDDDDDVEDAT